MSKVWILVANRSHARLFENTGIGQGITLIKDVSHQEGRLKNQDINADKPGRSFDSRGKGRHALSKHVSPTEHETEQFAKELAVLLNEGRDSSACEKIILVAEPGFLGVLKNKLSDPVLKKITAFVKKDLANVQDRDIPEALSGTIKL